MKLSFSTRGWQSMAWEGWVKAATEMHFNGIEVYNPYKMPELLAKDGPLNKYTLASTVRSLHASGLEIPCFDTYIDLADPDAASFEHLTSLIALASEAHVPYVSAYATEETDLVTEHLAAIIPLAAKAGVTLLIKTSYAFADTSRLREVLNHFACDELGALWDVHHPVRDANEMPAKTIENLGAYIKHVHLRDSSVDKTTGKMTYQVIGEGTLPLEGVMDALRSIDYDGFISLEWKPEWMEDLQDPEIIFPYFVNYMARWNAGRDKRRMTLPNHDGTGQYVWEKFELINYTFPEVLDIMADTFPDQYCFKYTTLDYTRTYSQFRDDVNTFARALVSLGVKPGSKVAIWAGNIPAWYITFWATVKIGAVLVTVNSAYKIHEVEYLLRQSDTHTLVFEHGGLDSDYQAIINELCPEIAQTKAGEPLHCERVPFLRNVITVGFRQPGSLTFDEAMARADLVPLTEIERLAANVRPDDVCNMQYTSGTTGFPKGVMLTHYNVVNDGKCIGDRMGLSTADRMMIQVPMFHCFGMVLSMTSSMTHGATMCPMPYFNAKASLACINQERITCFNGVPTMFIAMFNHEDYRKTNFSYMRTGIMAGSGCPPELMRRAARPTEMNMRGIVSVYGQTESSPGSTMSAWTDSEYIRTETVGYAFPHVEIKIIDPDTGEEVPDGENGEFCSRGYNTMKGYYKMPTSTRSAIDSEGWLHSGDLARNDGQGNYVITGRLKDMIIRGGENIYPKEIEEFYLEHPKVSDCQVIAVPDKKYGEEAMACIILKDGEQATEQEMRDYALSHIARHKVPRYIEFVDHFPMNAAGKIQKHLMRAWAKEKLGIED